MSKSLYDELIGDADIDIECPECGLEFGIQINQIGSTVTCPHCGVDVELLEEGDGLSDAKEVLDEFEDTLDQLSKP